MDPAFGYTAAIRPRQGLLRRQQAADAQRQTGDAMRQLQQAKTGQGSVLEAVAGADNAQAQAIGALPTQPTTTGLVQKVAGRSNFFGAAANGGAAPVQPEVPKIETPKLAAATGLIKRKM